MQLLFTKYKKQKDKCSVLLRVINKNAETIVESGKIFYERVCKAQFGLAWLEKESTDKNREGRCKKLRLVFTVEFTHMYYI